MHTEETANVKDYVLLKIKWCLRKRVNNGQINKYSAKTYKNHLFKSHIYFLACLSCDLRKS